MRFPIRHQFVLPLAAVAAASLLAIGVVNHRLATVQTRERVEARLRSVVDALARRNYPLTGSVLKQMRGLANAEFVLVDEEERGVQTSSPLPSLESLPHASMIARDAEGIQLGKAVTLGPTSYLHAAVWVDHGAGKTRRSVLHILIPQQDYNAAWWSAFAPPLLVGLATLTAVALVVQLVAGRLSRSLAGLGGEVRRLAEGDFSDVEAPAWNDEASDLANAVNQTARQLRDYENELRRTERLQTVSMIGAGLAHEMRNAATGCRLAIDLHRDACERSADDESLEVARRQLVLMEGRLQQLLQVSKPNRNSNRKPIDFGSVVEESALLAGPAIRHARVSLEWVAPEQRVVIEADPELVGQAVMNLLLNALDAAAKVSATACDAGRIAMELDNDGDHCELRVSDNGAGPNESEHQDVFEPFVTEKPEGVGLGLAVSKRIVESYAGVIDHRREGQTTVFCIRLPLAKTEANHA